MSGVKGLALRKLRNFMQSVEPQLPEKGKPRCDAKSPTTQDMLRLIPGFDNHLFCRRWGLRVHAQNAVRWLGLSIQ